MTKKILILTVFILQINVLFAQVVTNFNNKEVISERGKFDKPYISNSFEISAPDLKGAYEKEKIEAAKASKIFIFAHPVAVKIDLLSKISWIKDGGNSFGKFTLISKGAKSLSIDFDNFFLPSGTEMYIYNTNGEMIAGSITEIVNNVDRYWGSSVFKGEEINIEIKTPTITKEKLSLDLTNVAYGYKNIFVSKVGAFGAAGACNINVLCPQGNNWVSERNAVVLIFLQNGTAFGSGSMIMNSCGTNIPYLLTANHNYLFDQDVSKWKFFFQAWSSTCTPNQDVTGLEFVGSSLKANWDPSDFCLLQLNQTPAAYPLILASLNINYAGWSKSTSTPSGVVGIHHPSGDVMKISSSSLPVFRSNNTTWTSPGSPTITVPGSLHWRVLWPFGTNGIPTSGITEGGSSGSPLFDQNH